MPVKRLPPIPETRHACEGGCGNYCYTAYCERCAPPAARCVADHEAATRNKPRLRVLDTSGFPVYATVLHAY